MRENDETGGPQNFIQKQFDLPTSTGVQAKRSVSSGAWRRAREICWNIGGNGCVLMQGN